MKVGAYKFPGSVKGVLGKLTKVRAEDKVAEKKAKFFGMLMGIAIAAVIICFIAGFVTESVFVFVIAGMLVVPLIVFIVLYVQHKAHDLEDRKIDIPSRLLSVLNCDIPKDEKVDLELDFRDYRKGGEQLSKEGGMFSVRVYKFEHSWLKATVKLADGSSVKLTVVDAVTRKEKPKRKYTKVRERFTGRIELDVRLGRKRYGQMDVSSALMNQAPPEGLNVKSVRQNGSRLSATLLTGPRFKMKGRYGTTEDGQENAISADMVLQSLMWLYGGIGSQRKSA